jgi:hypothetical protein
MTDAVDKYKEEFTKTERKKLHAEVLRWAEETFLPKHRKEQEEAKLVMNRRNGIMNKATFIKIWSCLHTERLAQLLGIPHNTLDEKLAKKYAEAFNAFSAMEKRLLDEKDSPTDWQELRDLKVRVPETTAEMDAMKAKAEAERKAKRNSGNTLRRR